MPAKEAILDMISNQVGDATKRFLSEDYGASSFAEWAGTRLGVELNARDFKGMPFEEAEENAKRQAEDQLEDQTREAIEENLPADADPTEWNWQALASWVNTRYGLSLKDKDLKKFAKSDRE